LGDTKTYFAPTVKLLNHGFGCLGTIRSRVSQVLSRFAPFKKSLIHERNLICLDTVCQIYVVALGLYVCK